MWEPSFGNFRLVTFVLDFSLGVVRLGVRASDSSLGIFRLITSAQNPPLDNLLLGCFAWELSLKPFDGDRSLAIFRDLLLGSARPACAGKLGLSLGMLRLGTFALNFRFGSCA